MGYDKGDYILIRNDKVIAVSGNSDFDDGDHPVTVLDTDTIAVVINEVSA